MYVEVVLPLPVGPLFYFIDDESGLQRGLLVEVPVRNKSVLGFIDVVSDSPPEGLDPGLIRKVSRCLTELPKLSPDFIKFIKWVADYNLVPVGLVLKMCHCSLLTLPTFVFFFDQIGTMKPSELKAIHYLRKFNNPISIDDLASINKIKKNTIKKMVEVGILHVSENNFYLAEYNKNLGGKAIFLSEVQQNAFKHMLSARFCLLDGVTGSGKTEVYLNVIRSVLDADKTAQALIMLPEIALASHLMCRFKDYFGESVVEWHSGLNKSARSLSLQRIVFGNARIVVGARSALFLPYNNIKIIVVDEEHDPSYKQGDGICYNARDMAILLAKIMQIKLVMVSATPSLETIHNVRRGRFESVMLAERFACVDLPVMQLVDMRRHKKQVVSNKLIELITDRLNKKEQTLLFLNRRGYAPVTLCCSCGYQVYCKNCAVSLVYHTRLHNLICHYCGYKIPFCNDCECCGEKGSIAALGLGVEKLKGIICKMFPDARVAMLSSDNSPSKMKLIIKDILDNRVDIIIGTQIVTKGYHFPKLTLVGIINGDGGLSSADLRASERTYQILNQVAGRCGREISDSKGQVVVQSYNPDSSFMNALISYDRQSFYDLELRDRELASMPPYTRLISVIVSSKNEDSAERLAKCLARATFQNFVGIKAKVLGPVVSPIYLLRQFYRYRFLIIVPLESRVHNQLRSWLGTYLGKGVEVDVDPVNFA